MKNTVLSDLTSILHRQQITTGEIIKLSSTSVHIRTTGGVVYYPLADFQNSDIGGKVQLSNGVAKRVSSSSKDIITYRI